jgi:hypothetical protein
MTFQQTHSGYISEMIASRSIDASAYALRSGHLHPANVSAGEVAVFLPFGASNAVVPPLGIDRNHQRSNNQQGNDRNQIHLVD